MSTQSGDKKTPIFLLLVLRPVTIFLVFFLSLKDLRRNLKKAKGSREMATENKRADDIVFSQERESSTCGTNKYKGLVPKKKPLISQPKRAFFDSADWVLYKQQASADERTIEAIENLRPKLVRTPHKQLPPRGPTFATGQENLEWNHAQADTKISTPRSSSTNQTHHVPACPPPAIPPGVLVCKVDAVWAVNSGRCDIDGIVTGSTALSLSTISEAHSHVSSALMAEAIAVHPAVSLAVYSNIRFMAVLSDSISLIKLLDKRRYHLKEISEVDYVAKLVFAMFVTNFINGVL
ncbi:Endosulphine protein [Raphanus sativus]|nr:Endosulphine protein [Raphanus sativus]